MRNEPFHVFIFFYMLFFNVFLFCFSQMFADVRRCFAQRFADVDAVTLSYQFSNPIIILLCAKILACLVSSVILLKHIETA